MAVTFWRTSQQAHSVLEQHSAERKHPTEEVVLNANVSPRITKDRT